MHETDFAEDAWVEVWSSFRRKIRSTTMLCQSGAATGELLIRLASFSRWPVEPAMAAGSPIQLAAAGFRYTGYSDDIVCGHCDTVVRGWLGTRHNPILEHRCQSDPVNNHADTAERQTRRPVTENRTETSRSCRNKAASRPETSVAPTSEDIAVHACSGAVNRESGRLTGQLEADRVTRMPAAAAAVALSLSRQTAQLSIDNVAVSATFGDVRDAATADLSEPTYMCCIYL